LRVGFQRKLWKQGVSRFALLGAVLLVAVAGMGAKAEPATPVGDSPLDTLMKTKLHPDVPEAKDFVRNHRPDPESLEYIPLDAKSPKRPRIKNADELKALEADLDRAAARNRARAGVRQTPSVSNAAGKPQGRAKKEAQGKTKTSRSK